VDFELSEDQLALQAAARELLDARASSAAVRAHIGSGAPWDAELWAAMLDQGWGSVLIPTEQGGLGLGLVEAAVLCEEIGRHVAPAPFAPHVLASDALMRAGEAWGPGVTNGCMAFCPAGSGRCLAIGADAADIAVVWTPDALFALDPGRLPREPSMDLTRSLAWLELDPGDPRRARRVGGQAEATALLDRAAVLVSAEMLGAAERMLELATDYAKQRVQFGKPIGSFQAVKHRLADALVDVEGMRSAVWWAAWCVQTGSPDASVAASTAKIWCSDAARRVTGTGLQVHGGIGFTWEHDTHLFLKRAQLDSVSWGDAPWHRARLARLLRARVQAGQSVI